MPDTILHFHTGRGGRYNHAGHTTYCGERDIIKVLTYADNRGRSNFICYENEREVLPRLAGKPNLLALFEECSLIEDFTAFEKRTCLPMGLPYYVDQNGGLLISVAEAQSGVGHLEWDGDYDSDLCISLSDCGEEELKIIADSSEYGAGAIIEQFFDENTRVSVDWAKFNGNYRDLIFEYFNCYTFDIEDFYTPEN